MLRTRRQALGRAAASSPRRPPHRPGGSAGDGLTSRSSSSPICPGLLLHALGQSASRRAPMFDSMPHDGVKRPGTREMTLMLAALMGLNSFAIDAMIPALPAIGRSLNVANENDRQLVVVAYFI